MSSPRNFLRALFGHLPFLALPCAVLSTGSLAHAQTPTGLLDGKQVSQGSTDVAAEGFQAAAEDAPPPDEATELSVSGGALLAGGNSRSAAGTGVLRFLLRRDQSQVTSAAAANYAQSAIGGDAMETTVENYQGNLRYDYFLSPDLSVFTSVTGRRDRFQGLNLRLNVGPGVAVYLVRLQDMKLRAELGYDFQHDLRTSEALASASADGIDLPRDEQRHNGRLFAGYEQRLNDKLRFDTGLEYIRQLYTPRHINPVRPNWRLNYTSALSTEIIRRLSFAVAVTALYDNNPLPGVARLDVLTSLNLVYSLL